MNLIIDNGGTKAIWTVANHTNIVEQFTTQGIYPFHTNDESFLSYLEEAKNNIKQPISKIYFYSTGCSLEEQQIRLNRIFKHAFVDINDVEVATDLLGAARALCGKSPGIACIMGTGSNSCLYDGEQIVENRGGLGFILGDEGSGASIGLELIKRYLHGSLSKEMELELEQEYNINRGILLHNVYQKPYANKYLGSFSPFVSKYKDFPELSKMLNHQFTTFILKYILSYPNYKALPVHTLGSIAYYFSDELKRAAFSLGIEIKSFSVNPMPGLVAYHAAA